MNGARKVVSDPTSVVEAEIADPPRTSRALGPLRSVAAVVVFLLAWQFAVPLLNAARNGMITLFTPST